MTDLVERIEHALSMTNDDEVFRGTICDIEAKGLRAMIATIERLEAEVERLRKNECKSEGCTNKAEYCLDCLDSATTAAYMSAGEYR